MANIENPQLEAFIDNEVRPMAERLSVFKDDLRSLNLRAQQFAGVTGDTIIFNRPDAATLTPVTVADFHDEIYGLGLALQQIENAPTDATNEKFCVRAKSQRR